MSLVIGSWTVDVSCVFSLSPSVLYVQLVAVVVVVVVVVISSKKYKSLR